MKSNRHVLYAIRSERCAPAVLWKKQQQQLVVVDGCVTASEAWNKEFTQGISALSSGVLAIYIMDFMQCTPGHCTTWKQDSTINLTNKSKYIFLALDASGI